MIRIRRIFDTAAPANRRAVEEIQAISRAQFDDLSDAKISELPEKLHNPMKFDFRAMLFVCEDRRRNVRGFAQLSVDPDLKFGFLDLIALKDATKGGGVGAALYARVQEECSALGCSWLFLECLSELPEHGGDAALTKENAARLRFYERLGARPVIGTKYENPRAVNDGNAYFLLADPLGLDKPLDLKTAVPVVRAILKRKYKGKLSPKTISRIVESFVDDPVHIRPRKYATKVTAPVFDRVPKDEKITLTVSDAHVMHHIKDQGYVEVPVRVNVILDEILKSNLFARVPAKTFPDKHILAVHDKRFVRYFKKVALQIPPERSVFPDVFPLRKDVGRPHDIPQHAGYYCIDIYSPINRNSYTAARKAVDAAMTAAQAIEQGDNLAYALVRPPGHHAGTDSFGGYCYFNSAAIAAHYLSRYGHVAILDVDYHHGNGQEQIFYERGDVLTVSIHANPAYEYPYFSGYAEDTGDGEGEGYNLNLPLGRNIAGPAYLRALKKALKRIQSFKPEFLVIAMGLDTAQNDPSGAWNLLTEDFRANGQAVGGLALPTLVVQEGGYDTKVLGRNARAFLTGLWEGFYGRTSGDTPGNPA
jgi:acetoin utilization deacetylase AcuC-like enzyme/GNAT superfamily N-acetyltransferase